MTPEAGAPPGMPGSHSDYVKVAGRQSALDAAERTLIRSFGEAGWESPYRLLSACPGDEHAQWLRYRHEYTQTGSAESLKRMLAYVDFDTPPERSRTKPPRRAGLLAVLLKLNWCMAVLNAAVIVLDEATEVVGWWTLLSLVGLIASTGAALLLSRRIRA